MSARVIDKKIKGLVAALNHVGLRTTGSCEGHINQRQAPAPWVKITAPGEPSGNTGKAYQKWQRENAKLHRRAAGLLKLFYKNHRIASSARLKIEKAIRGFWIHNGGEDYRKWREEVHRRAIAISNGKDVVKKRPISARLALRRKKALVLYQKEAGLFADFLMKVW